MALTVPAGRAARGLPIVRWLGVLALTAARWGPAASATGPAADGPTTR